MHNARVPFMLLLDALTLIFFVWSFLAVAPAAAATEGMVLSRTAREMEACFRKAEAGGMPAPRPSNSTTRSVFAPFKPADFKHAVPYV